MSNVEIHTKICIALKDPFPIVSVTEGIEALLGFTADDYLTGRVCLKQQIHPDDTDIADMLFSSDNPGMTGIFNIRLRHADGRIRCIRGEYSKEPIPEGLVLNLLLQDAKSLPRTMSDSSSMINFNAIMENTDDYIYFKDRNHVFTGASQTLVSLCSPAEHWSDLLGKTDYDVFPEEYADIYYRLEKQVFAGMAVAHEIQEYLTNDGKKGWVDNRKYPIKDAQGELIGLYGIARDITELKYEEMKYKNIAHYDPLTKLPNRLLLFDRLDVAIAHANRNKTCIAVCMLDLDGFKAVRDDDTVARLGGDEFVVILTNLNKKEESVTSLSRLLNTISIPYSLGEKEINTVSASIGVSIYPDDKAEPEILLRHADVAMYESKNSGKNKFTFFNVASDKKIKANFAALAKIKKALLRDEFCLYYQPKVNSNKEQIMEVEALARWTHPLLGVISSNEFLPLIENDAELSLQFDQWVISKAIQQLQEWHAKGLYIRLCINISPREFKRKDFMQRLKEILSQNNVNSHLLTYLEFEILEVDAVENLSKSKEIIQECKAMGISFALDHFGAGFSSLMHLKGLNIHTIKIDKTFVMGMLKNSEDRASIQAIIGLANAFNINVAAEGVENIEQMLSLIEMGCYEVQGYVIAKPMPKNEIEDFIAEFVPDPRWKKN